MTVANARGRQVAAILVGVTLALGGCTSSAHHDSASTPGREPSYGALPTFLPTPTLRADRELTGTVERPAVTTEGDSVRAVIATGSVRVTVTGPVVPVQGAASEPDATTCTWTVTLSAARGRLPVAIKAFTALDEEGNEIQPHLAPGSVRPPATIRAGQTVRFELRAVMSAGEGVMRWAPGGEVVASWDFVAETD